MILYLYPRPKERFSAGYCVVWNHACWFVSRHMITRSSYHSVFTSANIGVIQYHSFFTSANWARLLSQCYMPAYSTWQLQPQSPRLSHTYGVIQHTCVKPHQSGIQKEITCELIIHSWWYMYIHAHVAHMHACTHARMHTRTQHAAHTRTHSHVAANTI